MRNDAWMNASLDELAEQCPELGIATEFESLARRRSRGMLLQPSSPTSWPDAGRWES